MFDVGEPVEHGPVVVDRALNLVVAVEHLRLYRCDHTVEATEDGERQDDPPVLRLFVVATQQVGHRP